MKIKKFEEIIAWKKSQDLSVEIYSCFNDLRDYSFKDQICRASVSISNNVAEGFDRSGKKEFVYFLYISLGSCSEVKSMLYLATRLNYISEVASSDLREKCVEISKIINGLIKALRNSDH